MIVLIYGCRCCGRTRDEVLPSGLLELEAKDMGVESVDLLVAEHLVKRVRGIPHVSSELHECTKTMRGVLDFVGLRRIRK